MALIDGKYILVESEAPSYPVTVTEQPVEKGVDLADHVKPGARSLSLSGVIAGAEVAQVISYLLTAKDKGQIVKYVGRHTFSGIISDFSGSTDYTTADGMTFSMELREIKIAASSYVETLPAPIKAQVAKIVNSGTKQTQSKKTAASTKKSNASAASSKPVPKVTFKAGSKWGTGNIK